MPINAKAEHKARNDAETLILYEREWDLNINGLNKKSKAKEKLIR